MFADRSPLPPRQVEAAETTVVLDDGSELRYWDTGGTGTPVVLAHPHTGNLRSWAYQQPVLVEAGYRAVGYSRRGYFGSAPCLETRPGTQAGDLAQLLDHLHIERAHLVGSAAGGSTALDFALSFPERTCSAIIASSLLLGIKAPELKTALSHLRAEWFLALPDSAKELGANYRALCPSGVERWETIRHLNEPAGGSGGGGDGDGDGETGRGAGRQPLRATIDWKALAANEVPMLLLIGGGDLYMPPAVLEAVSQRTGNCRYRLIEQCGHAPQVEAPEMFNTIVTEFLSEVG